VDEFHTNDIQAFVHDHFPDAPDDVHIQWIDDSSANIVFKTTEVARHALLSLVANPASSEEVEKAPFELRTAKPLASRPASMLMVRIAQQGDRKKKGAREASRYYLMHPDHDPTERMRREFANNRAGRGDPGDYRRRRFDDREHQRRRDQDHDADGGATNFEASMYDDAPEPETNGRGPARGRDLFSRVSRPRRRSASPGPATGNNGDDDDEMGISYSEDDDHRRARGRRRQNDYRDRDERLPPPYSRKDPAPFPRSNAGKELFGDDDTRRGEQKGGGGGLRSDRLELFPNPSTGSSLKSPSSAAAERTVNAAAAAKRLKTDLLNAAQTSPRSNHRRSHAMDAKNEEDLSERFARKSISMDSTKSIRNGAGTVELFPNSTPGAGAAVGLTIKGSADSGFNIKGSGGLTIKGRAEVKELFPAQYERGNGRNEGKELFDEPVREKKIRRRAGDLFD